MNMFLLTFFVLVATLCLNGGVLALTFPPGIEICHKSDPNFSKCVGTQMGNALKLFEAGYPAWGIPKLEPFEITKLEMPGNPGASVSLSQKYFNSLTYGVYRSEVYEPKYVINEKECYWDFMVLSPHIRVEADYELNGQLLVFPINGHGKSNVSITNLRNHHQASCELYKKKGKTYVRLTKYEVEMQGDKVVFDYQNLVPGNEQVSAELLKVMNENSQDVFKELKFGFETVWNQMHLQTANNVLSKFPADEIFPE